MAGLVSRRFALAAIAAAAVLSCGPAGAADEGFEPIFDGKSLDGWDGNPKFWSVEDGTITGRTTAENPTQGNTFLIWRGVVAGGFIHGGNVDDFELKLEYKIIGGNSGIQYRSKEVPGAAWVIAGYQGDFEAKDTYSGINYDEKGRGILAQRGQQTVIRDDGKPEVVGQLEDTKELQSFIKKEDWNEYRIVADGFTFVHTINGHVTSIVTDADESDREASGLLALQLHAGPPMTVQFRNIEIKRLRGEAVKGDGKSSSLEVLSDDKVVLDGQTISVGELSDRIERGEIQRLVIGADPKARYHRVYRLLETLERSNVRFAFKVAADETPERESADNAGRRRIVFVAGGRSHDYGSHEHRAGCLLLERDLKASGLPLETTLVTNGWPKDEAVFDDAAAVVIYADGGGGHPAVKHLDTLRKLADRGVGIVCVHYGVEVPKGEPGDAFLDAIGGYFEPHWSVNPHWTANYEKLPSHPITRGVDPFEIRDEWYYHMRFREGLEGVTPILTDVPTEETLSRPDGPHSGNPAVREAVAKREPQHVAWAYERPGGGRGFGFTGGHFHWNWGHDEFRQLVLNAIVWSAGIEVPEEGVPAARLTVADLEANQDEEKPANHNPARIQALLDEWNR